MPPIAELSRRLFVVPVAQNDHGKSHMMRTIVNQATRIAYTNPSMGVYELRTPWGRLVKALLFIRSYQEKLKIDHPSSLQDGLQAVDPRWRTRELIIMPSHLIPDPDLDVIIAQAHAAGFDAICVAVILEEAERRQYEGCWSKPWDERWTLITPRTEGDWKPVASSMAHDLWVWIASALTRQ